MATITLLVKGVLPGRSKSPAWSTSTLIRDGKNLIITDPGIVPDRKIFQTELKKLGLSLEDITHVFLTHPHLDHFVNISLFPNAIPVDYWGIWKPNGLEEKKWSATPKFSKGNFSKDVHIVSTQGHDSNSITIFVRGNSKLNGKDVFGTFAICGDVFWAKDYPKKDKYATNQKQLAKSRALVKSNADYIIPGHGDIYKTS